MHDTHLLPSTKMKEINLVQGAQKMSVIKNDYSGSGLHSFKSLYMPAGTHGVHLFDVCYLSGVVKV